MTIICINGYDQPDNCEHCGKHLLHGVKMVALYPRTHGPAPDRYRASAEWWRLHAEESAVPEQALEYADNQDRLADDMERRPFHYRCKPTETTDYLWSKERI